MDVSHIQSVNGSHANDKTTSAMEEAKLETLEDDKGQATMESFLKEEED
jgi:hypothetical protein